MYPWYKEKVEFFEKFINHLINEGRRLKEKGEKEDLLPD